jgi:hypothetical protein
LSSRAIFVVERAFCGRALLLTSSAIYAERYYCFVLKVAFGDHFFNLSWDLSLCAMLEFCEVVGSYSCRRILHLYSEGSFCRRKLLLHPEATLVVVESYSCIEKLLLSSKATFVFSEATPVVETHSCI